MELVAAENVPQVTFHLMEQDYLKMKKGDGELLVGGKMHDIKSVVRNNGTVTVVAVCDEEEDNIIGKIEKLLKQGSGDKKSADGLIHLLSLVYIGTSCHFNYVYCHLLPATFGSRESYMLAAFFAVSSPPPRVI